MEPNFKKLANELLEYTAPEILPQKLEALLREMYDLGRMNANQDMETEECQPSPSR
jgi:hypothetical protein